MLPKTATEHSAPLSGAYAPLGIAYVVHTFDMGGIERCVAHLCNHLDRSQFQPMVICLNRNGTAARWIAGGDVPIIEVGKRAGNDLVAVGRLAGVLRKHYVDLVHSHNWGTLMETALARRWARVPCHVHTEHGQGLHANLRGVKRVLRGWASRWALSQADAAVVCARSVRALVHARSGFPESRLRFIPNGVDIPSSACPQETPQRIRTRLGLPSDALVIGSVGRLVPVKGFANIIDATALLVRQGCGVHAILVGEGPERGALQARAEAAGVAGRVHLVGRQENVGDWLCTFDVYVNSSLSEAMSLGVLEAMAAGLPIVATNVGDNASLINGDCPCGLLAPPGDFHALADAIARLAASAADRRKLACNAHDRHQSAYSVECMVRTYQSLYLELFPQALHTPAVAESQ